MNNQSRLSAALTIALLTTGGAALAAEPAASTSGEGLWPNRQTGSPSASDAQQAATALKKALGDAKPAGSGEDDIFGTPEYGGFKEKEIVVTTPDPVAALDRSLGDFDGRMQDEQRSARESGDGADISVSADTPAGTIPMGSMGGGGMDGGGMPMPGMDGGGGGMPGQMGGKQGQQGGKQGGKQGGQQGGAQGGGQAAGGQTGGAAGAAGGEGGEGYPTDGSLGEAQPPMPNKTPGSSGESQAGEGGKGGKQGAAQGSQTASAGGASGGGENGHGAGRDTAQGEGGGSGGDDSPSEIPDDIKDDRVAQNDQSPNAVIARQLREAALAETDPVLREKIWNEYRKYAGGR